MDTTGLGSSRHMEMLLAFAAEQECKAAEMRAKGDRGATRYFAEMAAMALEQALDIEETRPPGASA